MYAEGVQVTIEGDDWEIPMAALTAMHNGKIAVDRSYADYTNGSGPHGKGRTRTMPDLGLSTLGRDQLIRFADGA